MNRRPVLAMLWSLAALGALYLAHARYEGATAGRVGVDFDGAFRPAAERLAEGSSPYGVEGYVYSPLVALLLAPFDARPDDSVFAVWAGLTVAAMVAAALLAALGLGLRSWQQPLLFGVFAVTGLRFWPMTIELFNGQVDTFVLLLLVGAAVCLAHDRPRAAAALLAVGGVIKTWPAAFFLAQLRRPTRGVVAVFVGFLMAAPTLALVVGGGSELVDFVRRTIRAGDQELISHSVWGFAEGNFSRTGRSQPLIDSGALQALTVLLLGSVIVVLAVLVVRRLDSVSALVHLAPFAVLLLPVSHLAYAIFTLPLLWTRLAHVLLRPTRAAVLGAGALSAWWLVVGQSWPDFGGPVGYSSLRYSVVFLTTFVAVSASAVLALAGRRPTAAAETAGDAPAVGAATALPALPVR